MAQDNITTSLNIDVSQFKKNITEANKAIKLANAEFKAASAGMDNWQTTSEGLSAKIKQLTSLVDAQKTKLNAYKGQLDAAKQASEDYKAKADSLKKSLQEMADNGVSETSEEFQKLKKELEDTEKAQAKAESEADKLQITFLNQQGTVNALEKDIRSYNGKLSDLESNADSAESDVEDLNDALEDSEDAFDDATDAANDSSDAFDDSGDAAKKSSEGFTVMKGALANLVADGFRKAIDAAKDFCTSMIDVAATVKAENAQFEQTFGDMADEAEAAIARVSSSTGILDTRLKSTATGIYAFARSSGADSAEAMELMETALMATADSAAYYDRSLEDTAETLQSFLKGNYANDAALGVSATETTRNAKAMELFGQKYNDLTEIQKQQTLLKMVTDSQELSGAMGQASREADGWENVQGNLNESWRQFKASVGTPFLEALIPVIQDVTAAFQEWKNNVDWDAFNEKVSSVANAIKDGFGWIIDHKDILIAALAGIAAGFVAFNVVSIISAVVTQIKLMGGAMAALNAVMLANPLGLVAAAIGLLVGAIVLLILKWDEVKAAAVACWDKIKEVWSTVAEWFKTNIVQPISNFFSSMWNSIKSFATSAWNGIKGVWTTVATWFNDNVVQPIVDFFSPLVEWFTALFQEIWDFIASVFEVIGQLAEGCVLIIQRAWEIVSGWFDENVIQPLKVLFTAFWTAISNFASETWDKIKAVWTTVATWFDDTVIKPVKVVFTSLWETLKTGASNAWEGVKKPFKVVASWFKEQFTKAWTNVKNVFSTGGKIFDGIKDGITDAFKSVVNAIIKGINKVVALPFQGINKALRKIRDVSILGIEPFKNLISEIDVPQIPLLAKGGVLKRGQVGLLEGDGAEAVVPLDQNKKWIGAVAEEMNRATNAVGSFGSVGGSVSNSRVNNFTQIINAPKAPSRIELYRQTRNLLDFRGV